MSRTEFDYSGRIARAQAALADRGVAALLASVGSDLPYLTGYESMVSERLTMAVIPQEGKPTLVVPELEAPRVDPRDGLFEIRPWGETEDPVAIVASLCGGPARLAIGDQTWSVFLLGLQQMMPGTVFQSARGISELLRLRKTAAEVDRLRAAGAAADRVVGRLADMRFTGRTERSLAEEIGHMTIEEGCDAAEFAIVAAGPNAASPHHHPGDRVIAEGDSVVVDFGGTVDGYCSDTTRTFHVGPPSAEFVEVYEVVKTAQQAGVDAVEPGAAAQDIDAVARRVIDEAGYGKWFIHRLGHGIGLDVHEDPYLVDGNEQVLEPGMTFSVEPGIYLPGKLGVRIEDIVHCTPDGGERLNNSSRELRIVG
ncbi:MAG: Xaa-Pro peptidase family protein [Acidimicrobiia bacterium]|nr:Xaa-Pro peptidase family protein [Acidimicrobiia bacterium]